MLLPEGVAIAASREAYLKFLGPIKDDGKLDNNLALSSRVEDITARLIAQAIFRFVRNLIVTIVVVKLVIAV